MAKPKKDTTVETGSVQETAKKTLPTLETAVKVFENLSTIEEIVAVANPYDDPVPGETTSEGKLRRALSHRFQTAKENAEKRYDRHYGFAGRYGRVDSVADAISEIIADDPKRSITLRYVATIAEGYFRAGGPDQKVAAPSATRTYTREYFEFLNRYRLLDHTENGSRISDTLIDLDKRSKPRLTKPDRIRQEKIDAENGIRFKYSG